MRSASHISSPLLPIAITHLDRARTGRGDAAMIEHKRVEIDDEVREQRIRRTAVDGKMKLAVAYEEVKRVLNRLFLNRQRAFQPQSGRLDR
jgi:hypothetical protein